MPVVVVDTNQLEWQDVPDSWPGKVKSTEPTVLFKPFKTDMDSAPAGQLVRYEPGHHEATHSHQEDEMFVILDGDLWIGDDELAPGSLAFVSGSTSYSPRTSGGCTFLRIGLGSR